MKNKVKLILIALFNLIGVNFILSIIWYKLGFLSIGVNCVCAFNIDKFEHKYMFLTIIAVIEYFTVLINKNIYNKKINYYIIITIISILLAIITSTLIYQNNMFCIHECENEEKIMKIAGYSLILMRFKFISLVLNIPTLLAFLTIYLKRRVK